MGDFFGLALTARSLTRALSTASRPYTWDNKPVRASCLSLHNRECQPADFQQHSPYPGPMRLVLFGLRCCGSILGMVDPMVLTPILNRARGTISVALGDGWHKLQPCNPPCRARMRFCRLTRSTTRAKSMPDLGRICHVDWLCYDAGSSIRYRWQ